MVDPTAPTVSRRALLHSADGPGEEGQDRGETLAREEPLEIRTHGESFAVIMRTPGHDRELVAGFLFAEAIVTSPGDITALAPCRDIEPEAQGNVMEVLLLDGIPEGRPTRRFPVGSSCGVCGRLVVEDLMADIQPRTPAVPVDPVRLPDLISVFEGSQPVFDATGATHGAGLFDREGNLLRLDEDVGRHNAVDKVVGAHFLGGLLPLEDHLLMVSGRVSFEIIQKAARAGIPMVAAVSAPTSLAVDLAERAGIVLIGFLRDRRYTVYTHSRVVRDR